MFTLCAFIKFITTIRKNVRLERQNNNIMVDPKHIGFVLCVLGIMVEVWLLRVSFACSLELNK